jgi:hypothetical protein
MRSWCSLGLLFHSVVPRFLLLKVGAFVVAFCLMGVIEATYSFLEVLASCVANPFFYFLQLVCSCLLSLGTVAVGSSCAVAKLRVKVNSCGLPVEVTT